MNQHNINQFWYYMSIFHVGLANVIITRTLQGWIWIGKVLGFGGASRAQHNGMFRL